MVKNNCCCSVAQSCPAVWDIMDRMGLSVLHYLPEFAQLRAVESVLASNRLILCCLLLLLPSTFPSTRVFSKESALHIRWPKYWSFSFSISLSIIKYKILFFFKFVLQKKSNISIAYMGLLQQSKFMDLLVAKYLSTDMRK